MPIFEFDSPVPAFVGDGLGKTAAWRPPSFRGTFAFWWRAVRWPQVFVQNQADAGVALTQLHREQLLLFGSPGDAKKGGQGKLSLRWSPIGAIPRGVGKEDLLNRLNLRRGAGQGQLYLLGQGLGHFRNGFERDALLDLRLRLEVEIADRSMAQEFLPGLLEAARWMGLAGGVGSRSRRGWGSLVLTGPDAIPHSPEALYNDLKARLEQATTGIDLQVPLAPFTALTPHARLTVCAVQARNAMEAMERIGRKLIMFRSNGRRVAGVAQRVAYTLNKTQEFSGTRFDLDKRRVIAWMSGAKSPDRPDRAIWGLPHNYSFSDARPTAVELNPSAPPLWGLPPGAAPGFGRQSATISTDDGGQGRRASPLFVHLHQFPATPERGAKPAFAAVFLLLPARFLEKDNTPLRLRVGKKPTSPASAPWLRSGETDKAAYGTLHEFLDALVVEPSITEAAHGFAQKAFDTGKPAGF